MRLAIALMWGTLMIVLSIASPEAEIYKWTDENGKTVYSQSPPPKGDATTVKTRRSPVSDESAKTQLKSLQEKADGQRKNRELVAGAENDLTAEAERRKKNCETAQANLKVLQEASRVRAKDEKGEFFYLDEKSKQKKMDETQAQIKEFCG